MLSAKRKAPDAGLQRCVRARREASEDVEAVTVDFSSDRSDGSSVDGEDNSDSGEVEPEVCVGSSPL